MRAFLLSAVSALIVIFTMLSAEDSAFAEPRFAARTGMACVSCHVNPSGGGMRNKYGANVYARHMLAAPWVAPVAQGELTTGSGRNAADTSSWFRFGADLRAAHFFRHSPDPDIENLNTFFLMQSDLYVSARVGKHLSLYMDRGSHGSFEAFGLFEWPRRSDLSPPSAYLKVGRFLPAYGIKLPNHATTIREEIGFSQIAKDTGLEAGAYWGPAVFQLGLVNGTSDDEQLDTSGTSRRNFEKALVARVGLHGKLGGARYFGGVSGFFNDNVARVNPLAPTLVVAEEDRPLISEGVMETRAGAYGGLALGRFSLLGEIDYIRDDFISNDLKRWHGYVAYAEAAFVPQQGIDVLATYEFADRDIRVGNNATHRVGGVLALFPVEYMQLRLQFRYSIANGNPSVDGASEVISLAHFFL